MTIQLSPEALREIQQAVPDQAIAQVRTVVMFLGHAHSGHSIIGAMLDSHPKIGVVNELNVPKMMLDHGLDRDTLYKVLYHVANGQQQADGWHNTEYKYQIPGGSQGHTTEPWVLGDKKGGGSTRVIRNHPQLFTQLQAMLGDALRIVHVIRNPFDNIAAYAHYWGQPLGQAHIDRYVENMETVVSCRQQVDPAQWQTIRYDDFIVDPTAVMQRLFDFIDIPVSPSQLANMAGIVNPKLRTKAQNYHWSAALQQQVKEISDFFQLN